MVPSRVGRLLRVQALGDFLLGLLFLSGTWDGLYDFLDLPQVKPALLVQVGGAATLALAVFFWRASSDRALTRAAASVAALFNVLAAVIVAVWLIFEDLHIGTQGTIELAVFAGLGALFALRFAARDV